MAGGFELGEASGYCGTGTEVRTLDPLRIDLEGTGFEDIQAYLVYANPNDICAETKKFVSGACKIDCTEGMTDVDTSCGSMAEQEYIKDVYGNAVCFDKEEAEKYISGQLLQKPKRLPVILAADAETKDENGLVTGHDVKNKVPESLREGLHILYRSDQGISFDSMVKNDCTLYSTEACQAPRESVDCEIGVTTAKKEDGTYNTPCVPQGCERLGRKTLSYGITTYPFGSTEGIPNTCKDYEPVGYLYGPCPVGGPCPVDSVDCVQGAWTDNPDGCNSSTGKQSQTRTTITAAVGTGTACESETQEIDCDSFDNDKLYLKTKDGIYLGTGSDYYNARLGFVTGVKNTQFPHSKYPYGYLIVKKYFTLDGPLHSVVIQGDTPNQPNWTPAVVKAVCTWQFACWDTLEDVTHNQPNSIDAKWNFVKQSDGGYKIMHEINNLFIQQDGNNIKLGDNGDVFYLERAT
jgi:hypothetical protein